MNVRIEQSWKEHLATEWDKEYFVKLTNWVREEYHRTEVFPPAGRIFAALDTTPFDDVKVVILGQDPYHDVGQANGLCFSVAPGVAMPPSLVNIFKEVSSDTGAPPPANGDLTRWARQGVLLLNSILTVRAHNAASHRDKGWELFTDAVIRTLSTERSGIVFLLWGSYAIKRVLSSTVRATWCSSRPTRHLFQPTAGSLAITISVLPMNTSRPMALTP